MICTQCIKVGRLFNQLMQILLDLMFIIQVLINNWTTIEKLGASRVRQLHHPSILKLEGILTIVYLHT